MEKQFWAVFRRDSGKKIHYQKLRKWAVLRISLRVVIPNPLQNFFISADFSKFVAVKSR